MQVVKSHPRKQSTHVILKMTCVTGQHYHYLLVTWIGVEQRPQHQMLRQDQCGVILKDPNMCTPLLEMHRRKTEVRETFQRKWKTLKFFLIFRLIFSQPFMGNLFLFLYKVLTDMFALSTISGFFH